MSINATRQAFFIGLHFTYPEAVFQHTPPTPPTPPTFPGSLTTDEAAAVTSWHVRGTPAYADLTTDEKAMADLFTAYDLAEDAWTIANMLARETQWHWARVDAAIQNYDTVPISCTTDGTGLSAPLGNIARQEP